MTDYKTIQIDVLDNGILNHRVVTATITDGAVVSAIASDGSMYYVCAECSESNEPVFHEIDRAVAEDVAIHERLQERLAADNGNRTTLADAAAAFGIDLDECDRAGIV